MEADAWPPGTVANLSMQSARWLITRGEMGADEVIQGALTQLPPEKVPAHLVILGQQWAWNFLPMLHVWQMRWGRRGEQCGS